MSGCRCKQCAVNRHKRVVYLVEELVEFLVFGKVGYLHIYPVFLHCSPCHKAKGTKVEGIGQHFRQELAWYSVESRGEGYGFLTSFQ